MISGSVGLQGRSLAFSVLRHSFEQMPSFTVVAVMFPMDPGEAQTLVPYAFTHAASRTAESPHTAAPTVCAPRSKRQARSMVIRRERWGWR